MSSSGPFTYANANGALSALAQYSGDPRTEWQLNAHKDKKSLLQAVANLPYKGGNTLTGERMAQGAARSRFCPSSWLNNDVADSLLTIPLGMALNFIRQQSFKTQAGMRPRARKIGVLITDGKSQDDVEAPSKKLKDEGVELFAVGKYGFENSHTPTGDKYFCRGWFCS